MDWPLSTFLPMRIHRLRALCMLTLLPLASVAAAPELAAGEVKQLIKVTYKGEPAAGAAIAIDEKSVGVTGKTGEIYLLIQPGKYFISATDLPKKAMGYTEHWIYTGQKPDPLSIALNPGALRVEPGTALIDGERMGVIPGTADVLALTVRDTAGKPIDFKQFDLDLANTRGTVRLNLGATNPSPGKIKVQQFKSLRSGLLPEGAYTIQLSGVDKGNKVYQVNRTFDIGEFSLAGSLVSPKAGTIPSASLTLKRVGDGLQLNARTDKSGAYEIKGLPAGRYDLEISSETWSTRRSIEVRNPMKLSVVVPDGKSPAIFFDGAQDWRALVANGPMSATNPVGAQKSTR